MLKIILFMVYLLMAISNIILADNLIFGETAFV